MSLSQEKRAQEKRFKKALLEEEANLKKYRDLAAKAREGVDKSKEKLQKGKMTRRASLIKPAEHSIELYTRDYNKYAKLASETQTRISTLRDNINRLKEQERRDIAEGPQNDPAKIHRDTERKNALNKIPDTQRSIQRLQGQVKRSKAYSDKLQSDLNSAQKQKRKSIATKDGDQIAEARSNYNHILKALDSSKSETADYQRKLDAEQAELTRLQKIAKE